MRPCATWGPAPCVSSFYMDDPFQRATCYNAQKYENKIKKNISLQEDYHSLSSSRASEDDTSTLKNLRSEQESRRGSLSEESDPSWTTMASRSSRTALRL